MITVFDEVKSINIYVDGETINYENNQSEFNSIMIIWKDMLLSAREMPAYCVSLDNETKQAILSGAWIEFDFEKVMFYNDMPFEKLLVEVKCEYEGCNLIRYTSKNGYDGRCYYLDLNDNMANLYNFIINSKK